MKYLWGNVKKGNTFGWVLYRWVCVMYLRPRVHIRLCCFGYITMVSLLSRLAIRHLTVKLTIRYTWYLTSFFSCVTVEYTFLSVHFLSPVVSSYLNLWQKNDTKTDQVISATNVLISLNLYRKKLKSNTTSKISKHFMRKFLTIRAVLTSVRKRSVKFTQCYNFL